MISPVLNTVLSTVMEPAPLVTEIPAPAVIGFKVNPVPFSIRRLPLAAVEPLTPVPPLETFN